MIKPIVEWGRDSSSRSCALLIICVNISSFCVAGCFLLATHKQTHMHTYINIYIYIYIYVFIYIYTHVSSLTTPKNRSCLTPHQHQHRIESNSICLTTTNPKYKGSATLGTPPLQGNPSTTRYLPFPSPSPLLAAAHLFVLNIINI